MGPELTVDTGGCTLLFSLLFCAFRLLHDDNKRVLLLKIKHSFHLYDEADGLKLQNLQIGKQAQPVGTIYENKTERPRGEKNSTAKQLFSPSFLTHQKTEARNWERHPCADRLLPHPPTPSPHPPAASSSDSFSLNSSPDQRACASISLLGTPWPRLLRASPCTPPGARPRPY